MYRILNFYGLFVLVTGYQLVLYNLRPDLEDKFRYREMLAYVGDGGLVLYTKEPIFSIFAFISAQFSNFFLGTSYYSIEFLNLIASLIFTYGLYRYAGHRKSIILTVIPLYLSYDFIYLVVETMRLHLAVALFMIAISYQANNPMRRNIFLFFSAMSHFSIGLLLPANLVKSELAFYFGVSVFLVLFVLVFKLNPNIPGLGIEVNELAGFSVPSERRFILYRIIIYILIFLSAMSVLDIENTEKRYIVLIIFWSLLFYQMGFVEMCLRLQSLGFVLSVIFISKSIYNNLHNISFFVFLIVFTLLHLSISPINTLLNGV